MTAEGIQELLDRQAIQALKSRYFRLLDTHEWDAWRRLFTDDARFEGVAVAGDDPDTFVAGVSERLATVRSVHQGSMPEIVFTGPDTARGVWAMFDYLEDVKSGVRRMGYGHYEEEYRREAGAWRIAFLRLTRLRVDLLEGDVVPADMRTVPLTAGWIGRP